MLLARRADTQAVKTESGSVIPGRAAGANPESKNTHKRRIWIPRRFSVAL